MSVPKGFFAGAGTAGERLRRKRRWTEFGRVSRRPRGFGYARRDILAGKADKIGGRRFLGPGGVHTA
jgi:hypothetical protein